MERREHEKDFRDKLETRAIKPRANSWDRLEEQLDAREKAQKPVWKWWSGIAAACLGLLFVLGFMFQPIADAVLVVEEQEVEEEHRKEKQFEAVVTKATPPVSKEQPQKDPLGSEGFVSEEMNTTTASEAAWIQHNETEVLLAEQMEELGLADLLLEEDIDDTILWQKLDELVAEAGRIQGASGTVSDAEIDALLLLAAEDISRNRPNHGSTVSADELLYEVEMELEESFRERVFELLKQGLERTRTAVVNSRE